MFLDSTFRAKLTCVDFVQIEISEVPFMHLHHLWFGTSSVLGLKAGIRLNCEGGDVWLEPFPLRFLPVLSDYSDLSEHLILTYFLVSYSMLQPYDSFSRPSKSTHCKYHSLSAPPSPHPTGFGSRLLRKE